MQDIEVFRCDRANMTLTPAGCARLWQAAKAKRPPPWAGTVKCVLCPVGDKNAGGTNDTLYEAERWRNVCPRCLKLTDRLILKKLCVSCYNRQAEAKRGRNCKGHRPQLADMLHLQTITVTRDGISDKLTAKDVLAASEMLVNYARIANTTIIFGWAPQL